MSRFMPFLDAQNLLLVRDELWKRPRRGACVMVGSGLSKNQRESDGSSSPMPSWADLAHMLHDVLNSELSRNRPANPPPSANTCPAIAQQFEALFGRAALDHFLLTHVPDDRPPHDIHTRLLELPWADVFTTNWDTLLERASDSLEDAAYFPVYSGADLGAANAPRIIKLHGSFPSHRPFIITEEDYRTYPRLAAPLVNTVQQALMEGPVLLLGFSGDDQNFLHWCGWVRDQLGVAAPRLYLGGYLRLNRPRRRLLEDRGVIPIDLADHPKAESWGSNAYRCAVEWILEALAFGEISEKHWPAPPARRRLRSACTLEPMLPPSAEGPAAENVVPPQGPDESARRDAIERLVSIWRRNRKCYPEWVVLPFSKVTDLDSKTGLWVNKLTSWTETWRAIERLKALRELVWRQDAVMNPHPRELKEAIKASVAAFDALTSDTDGITQSDIDSARPCRNYLLLSQLTEARFHLDQPGFLRLAKRLREDLDEKSEEWHRLCHEESLWHLTMQDFDRLRTHLDHWDVVDCDRIWALRKAAVLANMSAYSAALELAQSVLAELEKQAARTTSVRTMSRLAWALHWRMGTETAKWWDRRFSGQPEYPPIFDKWSQLAQYECDSYTDWREFTQVVDDVRTPVPKSTLFPQQVRREALRPEEYGRYKKARRAVRMIELAGLPSHIPGVTMAGEVFQKAAGAMASLGTGYALPAALMAGSSDVSDLLKSVLSPGNVAVLDAEDLRLLVSSVERGRDYYLDRADAPGIEGRSHTNRACANIRALAYAASRVDDTRATESLRWSLRYGDRRHGPADYDLWKSVRLLWQRSWRSMSPEAKRAVALDVVASSLLDQIRIEDYGDPAEVVDYSILKGLRKRTNTSEWAQCVKALVAGLLTGGSARKRAARRMWNVAAAGLLTRTEQRAVGRAIWDGRFVDDLGMPGDTTLFDYVYLSLPEPREGVAVRGFRGKWLNGRRDKENREFTEGSIAEISHAWCTAFAWQRRVELSDEEEQFFWHLVKRWLSMADARSSYTFGGDNEREPSV